ncbi:MAG: DUF58 domain-containing protein [Spirochaetota bacterium]
MIHPDNEAIYIAKSFSKRTVKHKFPIHVKSENPVYKKQGSSFDFKNIREYQLTDDLKKIDWKLYGRTERYYVKDYFEEEMLPIYIAIDTSSSMKLISDKKSFEKIICSICYMLLKLNFTLNLITFNSQINSILSMVKGENNYSKLSSFIESINFNGKTDINNAVKNIYKQFKPKILFIFSDFFDVNNKLVFKTLLKKLFIIHFFIPFEKVFQSYTDYEIIDYEEDNTLIIPYDSSVYYELKNKQEKFISILNSKSLNTFYFQILEENFKGNLKELYWQILEKIYE